MCIGLILGSNCWSRCLKNDAQIGQKRLENYHCRFIWTNPWHTPTECFSDFGKLYWQAIFADSDSILGSSQFAQLPQIPLKWCSIEEGQILLEILHLALLILIRDTLCNCCKNCMLEMDVAMHLLNKRRFRKLKQTSFRITFRLNIIFNWKCNLFHPLPTSISLVYKYVCVCVCLCVCVCVFA